MSIRSLSAAGLVAVGLAASAGPALAQGTRTVHVMGLSFEQPDDSVRPATRRAPPDRETTGSTRKR